MGEPYRLPARSARAVLMMAVIAATLLALTSCGPAVTSKAAASVKIALCGGAPAVHPRVVTVACANDSVAARDLRWSRWGQPVAIATGSAVVDLCAFEDCYAGDYVTVPIVIVVSKITRCHRTEAAYGRLQYVFVGGSPFAGLPARASIPDGSDAPANPADQTVALRC